MATKFFAPAFAAVLLITQPLTLIAQPVPGQRDWDVVQAVAPGDKLLVETKDGRSVKGKLSAVSDTTLTLARKGNPVSLDRAGVQRIYRLSGGSRVKSTLIGAGVGCGAGVGLAFAALSATNGSDEAASFIIIGMTVAAGIGAALGALAGGGHKRTLVYDAR